MSATDDDPDRRRHRGAAVLGQATARAGTPVARWLVGGGIAAAAAVGVLQVLDGADAAPPAEVRREDVPPGAGADEPPMRIAVAGPDRAPAGDEAPAPDPDLVSFAGHLHDERGRPLPGAGVEILRLHPDVLLAPFEPLPAVLRAAPCLAGAGVTDVEGAFAVEGVPPWGTFVLRLLPPGEPPRVELLAVRPEPAQRVDLGTRRLLPLFESRGLVVDSSGRAVAGARLRRALAPWQAPDRLGTFGALLELACRPEFDTAAAVAVRGLRGLCVLEPPAWFAELRARLAGPVVYSGDDGAFVWRSTDATAFPLAVDAPGHALRVVELAPGARGAQRTVLEPWAELNYAVTDVRGAPVAGAEVLLGVLGTGAACALQRAGTTDAGGRLRTPFAAGVPLVVAARCGEGEPWFAAELQPRLLRTLRLPARFPVEVRCLDLRGRPVEDARVRLVPGEPLGEPGLRALHQLGAVAELPLGTRERRPARGSVAIDDVPSGAWLAIVAAPGHAPRAVPFDVHGRHEVGVVLAAAGRTAVRARDARFVAVGRAPLVARPLDGDDAPHVLPVLCGLTERDGSAAFPRDIWRRCALSAAAPAFGWRHAEAGAGTEELELVLPPRGRIDGRLVSAREDFDPLGWLIVARREPRGAVALVEPPVLAAPRADGQFALPALEPDLWTVCAVPRRPLAADPSPLLRVLFDDLTGAASASLEVEAGSSATLVLDPCPPTPEAATEDEPVPGFRGVVRLDGLPAPGLTVAVEHGGRAVSRRTDAAGRFEMGELSGELVEVRVGDPRLDGELWRASIPAATAELAIELRTGAWSSIVTTADGRRARGVELVLAGRVPAGGHEGVASFRLRADARGFAAADALPAGRYGLRVMHPELGWLIREEVAIGPDEVTSGMSIRLEPLLEASGRVDAGALGVELPFGSELAMERVAADGVEVRRAARLGVGGAFRVEGLLPGRYRPTVRAALRVVRGDGTVVVVPPARSGIAVGLPELEVGGKGAAGLVLGGR